MNQCNLILLIWMTVICILILLKILISLIFGKYTNFYKEWHFWDDSFNII